ncbi:hypothetical protein BDZ89DRAFT_1169233 [Hymenopellis radicata]|nr:hypothetical protein BDZ89DRAFT_1169233 [Hymenopellis radicata]
MAIVESLGSGNRLTPADGAERGREVPPYAGEKRAAESNNMWPKPFNAVGEILGSLPFTVNGGVKDMDVDTSSRYKSFGAVYAGGFWAVLVVGYILKAVFVGGCRSACMGRRARLRPHALHDANLDKEPSNRTQTWTRERAIPPADADTDAKRRGGGYDADRDACTLLSFPLRTSFYKIPSRSGNLSSDWFVLLFRTRALNRWQPL